MLNTLKNAWRIPELRKKLLYTILILIIYRIGCAIPVPFLDPEVLKTFINTNAGSIFGYLDMLAGGAFSQATIFAMGVTPYINASIIMQLLTVAIPALERMQKEGETGRKKLGRITRYATFGLALGQAVAYYILMRNQGAVTYTSGFAGIFTAAIIMLVFTAGTAVIVWLGEQINDKGIGNGISFIIFVGIISRGPAAVATLWQYLTLAGQGQIQYYFVVPAIIVLFVLVIAFVVLMSNAERRIPVQYAKVMRGRRMYGGQSTHIPIKVNMSGVMPIIFASSFLSIPSTIKLFFTPEVGSFWDAFFKAFSYEGWLYAVLYFLMIIGFNYFYVGTQYNPVQMANDLKKNNGSVPGLRPGKPTSDFIAKILSKVVLIGALFLGVVAVLPIVLGSVTGVNIALGGTSILIVVGVALELEKQIEQQMMMRHYKGFLE